MLTHTPNTFDLTDAHLALLSAGLNSEQLAAVRETRNVVVSAGAGSGKTTVLASRYAYLVEAKNVPCEKILTLTFTKKAANEMKERIFNGLKNHLHGYPIKRNEKTEPLPADFPHLDEIKARARAAIESFDKTHIQTLDSYFSEIAKKGAHFYGINPNFALDDEKIGSVIRHNATKYVLEHLSDAEIKEIATVFQIQNVAEDLFAASVLRFSTILTPIDFASSLEKQKIRLISDYKTLTEKINEKIGKFIALPRNPKASGTLVKLYEYIEEVANPEAPPLPESVFESAESAKSFLEKRFFAYCKSISDYCGGDFSHVTDVNYKTMKKNLLALLEKLYLLANSISGFALTANIFAHLVEFQRDANRSKRVSGLLTFSDVTQLALRTLCEHADIRTIEQNKFDAIMIDEFQDDNQLQCDVLLILSDKNEKFDANGAYLVPKLSDSDLLDRLDTHKLFFVGDDKQSIYRFRGADVSVFRNLSASIKNTLELKTNYRSEPELIRGFNTIFGGFDYPNGEKVNDSLQAIFMTEQKFPPRLVVEALETTEKQDSAETVISSSLNDRDSRNPNDRTPRIPDFEADYKRVEVPDFKLKKTDFSEKKITIALYPKKDDEEGENPQSQTEGNPANAESEPSEADRQTYECEASFVAREIKHLLAQKDENGAQKYHYRDIALLFRTATPTAAYENVLLANGIPYSTEVYKGFFSDGPINDIISLLKLCVYPNDKNAYAKVLRSPFCSLTFAELEKVLVSTENPYRSPFDAQMLAAISADSELSAKILNLKAMYDDINARLKTEKLTKTISYIWYELGYRYETMWNKSVAMYASFYEILFELARLSEGKTQSLAAFIDMVKSYEDSDKKLDKLDVVMDATDAVQILTVHKSKGLEFKVVFVCAASARPNAPSSGIDLHGELGFLLKTPAWRDYQKAAEHLAKTGEIRENEAQNYFFSLVADETEKQESAELRRLAYVAFTRAEERLYIVGNESGEFSDEVDGVAKSQKFALHAPEETSFTYTKTHKREKGEVKPLDKPKETEVEYVEPVTVYQLLLPMLFDSLGADGVQNPVFHFVNDKTSFAAVSESGEQACAKSDFIKALPDSENAEVMREELSPRVYVSPSKLKIENGKWKMGGGSLPLAPTASAFSATPSPKGVNPLKSPTISQIQGNASRVFAEKSIVSDSERPTPPIAPANSDYELINKIVASTVPTSDGKIPILEDEGEEIENGKLKTENDGDSSDLSPAFSFANFGTIAHAYMEAAVLGEEPKVGAREWIGVNERFIPNVKMESWGEREKDSNRDKKIAKIRELCGDMAARFAESAIYKEAAASEWKKTEYSFRGLVEKSFVVGEGVDDSANEYADELIVTGQIDLVYKNPASSPFKYTIVDYKTNQTIAPRLYQKQLACYRKAVSAMLGCAESEIRCVLYYLRFAEAVDITERL